MASVTRFERSNATKEPRWVKYTLISTALIFFGFFLLLRNVDIYTIIFCYDI